MGSFLAGIVADFAQHWPLYVSIPIVAALIGYGTKLVAIRMMFQPVEFIGVKPFLGWQGIVPKRAARMASIACDTMTEQLIKPAEVVARLDASRIAQEIEKPLLAGVEDIVREVAGHYQPGLWESLPVRVQRLVIERVQHESPRMVAAVLDLIKSDVDSVFDLKGMVVTSLVKDKRLLNRIFQEAGAKEFKFIARSGLVFGGAIGIIQMVAWVLFKFPPIMPIFGLFTGWFTDWLALRMIFYPIEPRRYFGVQWQGLFLKRRAEVAEAYGSLIAKEIITPHNVIEAILHGPLSDRVLALIQRQLDRELGSVAKPLLVFAVGSRKYQDMKLSIASQIMSRLPETMRYIEDYATDAMDIRNVLVSKMKQLSPKEFERLLRPAFEQDEWILIATGAVLGFAVGEAQVLLLEHLAA
ncbi:uncharacterized membrane protein YheB (UPF0754 family) [Amycolatopsis lexingtonensis]|uniref:Uncharacterized membrane protein YheB (UPF0754 family) n=1 Tax=Amycolatopsis lexingtonensis TaxID=218822 RepID=A0ABR9IBA3_9PSEU|nr:DUF445 domain-containing protein [Amycolatopsis lexingtonensis]MBE1500457.1 uncharacterized membrane protein YheB (UPF0754 family) [Amycolatopsis lexingtonensis]